MWIIIVGGVLFLGSGILFFLMTKAYKTRPVAHSSTPEKEKIIFDEVWFATAKNLKLYGWWIPVAGNDPKPVVVLAHGWQRNVQRMMPYIKALHKYYNLLAFDSRNHGSSDKDEFSSMPKFSEDIIAAIDFACAQPGVDASNIGVVGLSMGGSASIYAASKDKRIKSIVTVGAFANPKDIMKMEFKKRYIPYFPFVYLFFEYVQYKIGQRFNSFAPENNIQKVNAKILLIHGSDDVTAPFSQAEKLFKAAKSESTELWAIEGAGHSNCHKFPGFWDRINFFLQNSFQPIKITAPNTSLVPLKF